MKATAFFFAIFYLIYGRRIFPRLIMKLPSEIKNITQGIVAFMIILLYLNSIAPTSINYDIFFDVYLDLIVISIIIAVISYHIFNIKKDVVIGNLFLIFISIIYISSYMNAENTVDKFVKVTYYMFFGTVGLFMANYKIIPHVNRMLKHNYEKMDEEEAKDVLNKFGNIMEWNNKAIKNNFEYIFNKNIEKAEYVLPKKDKVKNALLSSWSYFVGNNEEKKEGLYYMGELYSSLGNYADDANINIEGIDEVALLKSDFNNRCYMSIWK